jgi:diguanylate cyclase (GGDEF)-like protein
MDRVGVAVERIAIPAPEGQVVTISCGVASLDLSNDKKTEDSLRRADAALYRAKSGGRNRVETDGA